MMNTRERREYEFFTKRAGLIKCTRPGKLYIPTSASTEYKCKMHKLYADWGYHPVSISQEPDVYNGTLEMIAYCACEKPVYTKWELELLAKAIGKNII